MGLKAEKELSWQKNGRDFAGRKDGTWTDTRLSRSLPRGADLQTFTRTGTKEKQEETVRRDR